MKKDNTTSFSLKLATLFFFSGFASLMYQVAWQRLLTLIYGVGSVSTTIVVSVYMFGLGIGALLGGRFADSSKHWVRTYAVLELALAFFGVLSLQFVSLLSSATAGSSLKLAFLAIFAFLSFPTILMGATLPILIKLYSARTGDFFRGVSLLYFVNTLGAAAGAICTSYIFISFWGLDGAIYAACTTNLLLALSALKLGQGDVVSVEPSSRELPGVGLGTLAYLVVLATGFLAIGYEMVWFRLLGTLLKASPYTFPSVLAIYLLGIAIGSLLVSRVRHDFLGGPKNLFFFLQFGLAVSAGLIILAYYYLSRTTMFGMLTRWTFDRQDHHPTFSNLDTWAGWFSTLDVFLWPIFFIFVPTLFMGASFPLITWLELKKTDGEGGAVGKVYFWMILGNVLGGIVTGFFLFPLLGTERTTLLFVSVGVLFGLAIGGSKKSRIQFASLVASLLTVSWLFFPKPGDLYFGVILPPPPEGTTSVAFDEGVDSVVLSYQSGNGTTSFINGLLHGGRSPVYFYEALEALRWSEKVDHILIIGFGTGNFVEAVLASPEVERVTILEISPTLIRNLSKFDNIAKLLSDPRVELIVGDGRRYLQSSDEFFDMVTMDPLRTTSAYSNNLYSQEFFELIKQRMRPTGVLLIWMDEFRVIPKTLFSVFSQARCYEVFCLASQTEFVEPARPTEPILENFPEEYRDMIPNFRGYVGPSSELADRCEAYPVNRDWKPWSEYYLGLRALHGERAKAWNLGSLPEIKYFQQTPESQETKK